MSDAQRLQAALLGAMALAVLAVMLGSLHHTFLHVPTDNNEGWNAYHALLALSGGMLYPPADSLISTNYPPLSFFIVGFAGKLIGDNIIAGRLISILGLLVVSINVFWLTRLLGGARFFAAFSSLLFLLYVGANAAGYVAMNDPQWLGHAFTTSGAVFFLIAQQRTRMRYVLLSSLLCVIGVLIKQNLVVLPLALFVWSLFNERRRLWSWTFLSLSLGSVLLLLAISKYGPVLLQDIFLHQRVISVRKFESNVTRFVMPLLPLLVCCAILGAAMWRDRLVRFALVYVLIAGALGLFFLSGELCDVNIVFDLMIALCVSAGLLGTCIMTMMRESHRQWTAAVALILASACLPTLGQAILDSVEHVREDRRLQQAYQDLIGQIAVAPGPVACEMTSLCYWAGKSFELDAHNYLEKIKKGKVTPDLLKKLIDEQFFSYLQATAPPDRAGPVTEWLVGENLSNDVDARYTVVKQVGEQRLLAVRR